MIQPLPSRSAGQKGQRSGEWLWSWIVLPLHQLYQILKNLIKDTSVNKNTNEYLNFEWDNFIPET